MNHETVTSTGSRSTDHFRCLHISQSRAKAQTLQEQNDVLFEKLKSVDGLQDEELKALRKIFAESRIIGQGNPAITHHPVTPAECEAKLKQMGVHYENATFEKICKAKYMAPLYDPSKEQPEDAKACIDQFEFPDIPCEYPVVWVKAREAAEICSAEGKRLCDAHEWEGACAGSLEPPDYRFDLAQRSNAGRRNPSHANCPQPGLQCFQNRGAMALNIKKEFAPPQAQKLLDAMEEVGPAAVPTLSRQEIFPVATALCRFTT